jgi:hypothetical protein
MESDLYKTRHSRLRVSRCESQHKLQICFRDFHRLILLHFQHIFKHNSSKLVIFQSIFKMKNWILEGRQTCYPTSHQEQMPMHRWSYHQPQWIENKIHLLFAKRFKSSGTEFYHCHWGWKSLGIWFTAFNIEWRINSGRLSPEETLALTFFAQNSFKKRLELCQIIGCKVFWVNLIIHRWLLINSSCLTESSRPKPSIQFDGSAS